MPRKTKKQKIAAAQRKHYHIIIPPVNSGTTPTITSPIPTTHRQTVKAEKKKEMYVVSPEDTMIKKFFIQDLRKSFLLIGSLFTLEILLYFVSMMGK